MRGRVSAPRALSEGPYEPRALRVYVRQTCA
jgi:hypothetical protein